MWNDPNRWIFILWRESANCRWTNQRPRVCPVEPTDYSDAGPGPWNAPTEPPDGHTSSLASNHVRHRPHLQARRAHRAQGLGTRPIRITPEPRHRPARVPGNARSGVGLEHRCQTPARLATARERAARRTRRGRERRGRTAGHLEGFDLLPRVSVVGIRPDRPGAREPSIDPSASDIYPHLIRGKLQIPSCKHSLTPAHTRSPE